MTEIENLKIGNGGTLHIVGNEDIVANAWQAGKTYVKNKSYVIREHRLYVCNVTHTSVEPFDATKWTEITIGDAIDNALNMTDTASGAIATFESEYALPLHNLEIEINAVQEGSGTPSPNNVRPITGFSSANVTRCGVNLMHVDSRVSQTTANVTYTSDDNYIYLNGVKNGASYAEPSNLTMTLPSGTYYLKAFVISGTASNTVSLYAFDGTNVISPNIFGSEASMTLNKTTTFRFRFAIWADGTVLSNCKIGIVISKASISEYSEYNGSIYNIAFTDGDNPLTVYGGTLDVTSGVLTVNKGYYEYTNISTSSGTAVANGWRCNFVCPTDDKNRGKWSVQSGATPIFSMFDGTKALTNGGISKGYAANEYTVIVQNATSKAEADAILEGLQLCYELATPQTIQLTPTQISAIVGTNNVFTDTNGDTSLEYYTKRGEQTVRIAEGVAVDVINNKNIDTLNTTNKTLVGAVNEVAGAVGTKANKEWTTLGNYSGTDTADISGIFSTANEIKIVARTYTSGQLGSSQVYTTIATTKEITDFLSGGFTELHYIQGMNNGQQNVIDFGISNTAIRLATFILNGNDVKSTNTGFKIYYR